MKQGKGKLMIISSEPGSAFWVLTNVGSRVTAANDDRSSERYQIYPPAGAPDSTHLPA